MERFTNYPVILAQGPCKSSQYRSNFNICVANKLQKKSQFFQLKLQNLEIISSFSSHFQKKAFYPVFPAGWTSCFCACEIFLLKKKKMLARNCPDNYILLYYCTSFPKNCLCYRQEVSKTVIFDGCLEFCAPKLLFAFPVNDWV